MLYRFIFPFLALFIQSHAILLHESVDDDWSRDHARQFPAVCKIEEIRTTFGFTSSSGHGSGALVEISGRRYILSAKHVFDNENGTPSTNNFRITFDNGTVLHVSRQDVIDIPQDPEDSFAYLDVSLTRVNQDTADITPMKLQPTILRNLTKNTNATIVGFGDFGRYDDSGRGHYIKSGDGVKRSCQLYIRGWQSLLYKVPGVNQSPFNYEKDTSVDDAEQPIQVMRNHDGSFASGDSGGPLIDSNNNVIGVVANSLMDFIECDDPAIYNPMAKGLLKSSLVYCDQIASWLPPFQRLFRICAQKIFGLPQFTVRVGATFLAVSEEDIKAWFPSEFNE